MNKHRVVLEVVGEHSERHLTIFDEQNKDSTFYFTAEEWEALVEEVIKNYTKIKVHTDWCHFDCCGFCQCGVLND